MYGASNFFIEVLRPIGAVDVVAHHDDDREGESVVQFGHLLAELYCGLLAGAVVADARRNGAYRLVGQRDLRSAGGWRRRRFPDARGRPRRAQSSDDRENAQTRNRDGLGDDSWQMLSR